MHDKSFRNIEGMEISGAIRDALWKKKEVESKYIQKYKQGGFYTTCWGEQIQKTDVEFEKLEVNVPSWAS